MAVNYTQAAQRHFGDSQTLTQASRPGNASHLAGLAAECALKAILPGLGALVLGRDGRPVDEKHKRHVDRLWDEFQQYLHGPKARTYVLSGPNPFSSWSVNDRYEEDSAITLQAAADHSAAARQAMQLLQLAQLEGDVR